LWDCVNDKENFGDEMKYGFISISTLASVRWSL